MDHREIGQKLQLFMQHELAPGCPIWLPNGTILYNILSDRIRKYNAQHGYHEVRTPVLWNHELYKLSGHWDHYQDFMFGVHGREEDKLYNLKPMNCPGHMLIFKSRQWSYQDLPYRLHDQGILHRDETSGAIGGLTRCRAFCQDDGHVFLRTDQIMQEVVDMVKMVDNIYTNHFDMRDLRMVLSTRPDKYLGESGEWDHAEAQLKLALRSHNFTIDNGGGAFYGPKVDFFVKDSQKREWQTATIQLDFQLPQRFQLEYTDQDGVRKTPVVIHRAYYGSFERFIAILLEHYQERLPFWLCPVQAIFLPIADRHIDYCRAMEKRITSIFPVRVEVDASNNRVSAKVLHATERLIPYMLVVGDQEVANDTLNVRHLYDKSWEGEKSWRVVVDRFFAWEKPSF